VLPTYNEAENIESITKAIFAMQSNISTHQLYVIVVDDNSPDGTQEIVKQQMQQYPNLRLITGNKVGLGDAYKRGISFAVKNFNPDLLLQMDADGQHDAKLIPEFINLANNGFDLVIGSRFVPGGKTPDFSTWRKFLSIAGNFLIRHLGKASNVQDCTSGFRCIKTNLVLKCDLGNLSTKGYSFQSSLVCELIRNGAKLIEVPIIFKDRVAGQSKLSLQDQIEFLVNITKITYQYSEDFIRYCLVGLIGTLVNIGVYLLFNRYFHIPLQVASLIAIEASIVSNFFLNNYWTFKTRPKNLSMLRRLVNFHIAAGISGILFYYLFFLFLTTVLGINDVLSILFATTAGTISNYTINSIWTWRR
jgi:dolichol-phosphate mannosyltransferase